MLTLFQAEWCPHSRRVRQRLTELMLPFVALQVEPEQSEREELRETAGTDAIPVLLTEDGDTIGGAFEIIAWLDDNYEEPELADGHRAQARAHRTSML